MKIKVLGINGSARRQGNTSIMISEALQGASELKELNIAANRAYITQKSKEDRQNDNRFGN